MARSRVRTAPLPWVAATILVAVLVTGGAPEVRRSAGGAIPPGRPRAALMPFENLAGREEQSLLFTRIFFAQLVASGALEMVEPAEVEAAMDSLGIRASGSMTMAEVRAMADTLHAPFLLLGSVLESGSVEGANGPVPSAGATLRLVQASTGRVWWAGVHFRSGEDRESVFGWGRVRSVERLILELASEILRDFRDAGAKERLPARTEATR